MIPLQKLTLLMLTVLATATVAALLMGGFMPLFSVAGGLLFLYYLVLYFGMRFVTNTAKNPFIYGFWVLFLGPIVLTLIDPEAVLNFLLQGIHLDMK